MAQLSHDASPRPSRARHGFTLIELLVVISIIALLISMLLPALGSSRRTAREAVCGANSKSALTAFHTYATDHDGYLPDMSREPSTGTHRSFLYHIPEYWRDSLRDWYGLRRELMYSPTNPQWNSDNFYWWTSGDPATSYNCVIGHFYLGSTLAVTQIAASMVDGTPANPGKPIFPRRLGDDSFYDYLWIDLSRQYPAGPADVWVTPGRHGANHLTESGDALRGTHIGHLDGHVAWRPGTEMRQRAVFSGAEYYW